MFCLHPLLDTSLANAAPLTSIKLTSCLRMRILRDFFSTSSGGILSPDLPSAYHSHVALLSVRSARFHYENS
jgi:hypothetical protein